MVENEGSSGRVNLDAGIAVQREKFCAGEVDKLFGGLEGASVD